MNRITHIAKRNWRYAAGFAIIGIAVLGYAIVRVILPGRVPAIDIEWLTLFNLLILQAAALCFAVSSRHCLPKKIRHNLHFVILFASTLLLSTAGFVIVAISTHIIQWGIRKLSPDPKNDSLYSISQHLFLHLASGTVTQSVQNTQSSALTSFNFLLIAIFAIASYLSIYYVLRYGVQKIQRFTYRNNPAGEAEGRSILINRVLLMCLGYITAVVWQAHSWMVFVGLIPLALLLRQVSPNIGTSDSDEQGQHMLTREIFEQRLTAEFERARRYDRPLTVLMVDVDNMRHINSAHGYIIGDQVLSGIVKQILNHFQDLGDQALIGHWQGKTYIIALPELNPAQIRHLAQTLCERIDQNTIVVAVQPEPIRTTLSVGYAHIQPGNTTARDLIETARQALTRAKMTGKNRVVTADELPQSAKVHPVMVSLSAITSLAAGTGALSNLRTPPTSGNLRAKTGVPQATAPSTAIALVASSPTERSTSATKQPAAPISLAIYITVVAVLGSSVAVLGWIGAPIDWTRILLMAGLAILAQFLQVELYGSTSMSVAVAISFGSLVMDGIPGAIISSAAIALAHRARETRKIDFSAVYKTIFNWSVHALASFLPVYFARLINVDVTHSSPVILIGFAILASLQIFLVESGLMAIAIGMTQRRSPYRIWQEQYRWLLGHYVTLCLLGLFLGIGYSHLGLLGLAAFALPVAMMHYSQRQYVERTAASLRELRRMNEEISVANEEIKTANHAISQLNNELFLTLSKIIDARDPFALGHASKVAQYATAIAERMKMSEAQRELIWQVSLLHDIGKLGIPENILQKPGALTVEEYELLKTHSQLGADLLETSHGLRHLAPYVKTHHENWSGGGYPDGISGDAIPLETRIVTLADAVDAMASDRPYHKGLKPGMVLTEVIRCRGEQFDPIVVDAFMQLIDQHGESYITNSASQVQMVRNTNKHGTMRATAWPFFVNTTGSAGRLEVTKRG